MPPDGDERIDRATGSSEAGLRLAWPIDLALTVASHGWAHLAPWRWDPASGRLAHTERIGARVGTITVAQLDPTHLIVECDGFAAADVPEIRRRVGRWLSAEWDPGPAIAALGPVLTAEAALIAAGGGRILRCSSFYEDFVKTVLTINTSWAATCRMAAALVEEPGGGAFPSPRAIIDYGEAGLRGGAKLGFRAATAISATRHMLDDGAIDEAGEGEAQRLGYEYLTGLKGIGPYAASHCRVLLHDFTRIPVDSEATAYFRARHGATPGEFVAGRPDCGDYLALGYKLMRLREKLARSEADRHAAGAMAESLAAP